MVKIKNQIFLSIALTALSLNLTAQTYSSVVQLDKVPAGTEEFSYHPATIIFTKAMTQLKIYYNDFPDKPFIFTLEKVDEIKLSGETIITYQTLKDLNYSYLNHNSVSVQEFARAQKLDEQYSYDYAITIAQKRSVDSIEASTKYFIKRSKQTELSYHRKKMLVRMINLDEGSIKSEVLAGENVSVKYHPESKSYLVTYLRKNNQQGTVRLRFLSAQAKGTLLMIDDNEDQKYYVTDDLGSGGSFNMMLDRVVDRVGMIFIVTD